MQFRNKKEEVENLKWMPKGTKKTCLWMIACGILSLQILLPGQAHAAEAGVTWKKVTQGINTQDKYVYDGNKTDETMFSRVLEKTSAGIWGYIDQGKVKNTDSILTPNGNGWWHVVNGWVDTSSGIYNTTDGAFKFANGRLERMANQTVDSYQNQRCYLLDGKVDRMYTGLAANENGIYWVSQGTVDESYTSIVKDTIGLTNTSGWFCIKNGIFDASADTIAKNDNGWWKIRNGLVDFSYNGLAKNENGWFYLEGGKVNFGYNGVAQNENGIWYVADGKVDLGYNGHAYGYYFTGGKAQ